MRRRPLLRAAAVGGTAYYAGRRAAQHNQAEAEQDQRLGDLEQQQYGAPAPAPAPAPPPAPAPAYAAPAYATAPPPPPPASGITAQLEQLAALRQQGALTEEEFSAAKSRLLGAPG
jgi:hypothetical protein